MLKLICNNSFILFRIVASGNQNQGLLISEGRNVKSASRAHRNESYWFDSTEDQRLLHFAASMIRAALDREFYHPNHQLGLFEKNEITSNLVDTEDEPEEPILIEAYELAVTLPTTVKWRKILLAAPSLCSLCSGHMVARSIAHIALVKSPAGPIMHLQCPECRVAAGKVAVFEPRDAAPSKSQQQAGAA